MAEQTHVVTDAKGAEVVRWVGEAAAVAPVLREGYVELWADGVMVQRNQLGNREPASLRFVSVTSTP